MKGTGFSPYMIAGIGFWALAPEGMVGCSLFSLSG
jgi:hypothetical protein